MRPCGFDGGHLERLFPVDACKGPGASRRSLSRSLGWTGVFLLAGLRQATAMPQVHFTGQDRTHRPCSYSPLTAPRQYAPMFGVTRPDGTGTTLAAAESGTLGFEGMDPGLVAGEHRCSGSEARPPTAHPGMSSMK